MADRITKEMLERRVSIINEMTGSPSEAITDRNWNVGSYCLSGAYGGHALERIVSEGGGVTSIFNCGYVSKRELFNLMGAFIEGFRAAKSN